MTGGSMLLLTSRHFTSLYFLCSYDAQDSGADDVQPVANRGNVQRPRLPPITRPYYPDARSQAPNLSIGAAASPQRLPLLVRTPSSDSGLLTKPSLPSAGRFVSALVYHLLFHVALS